MNSRRMPTSKHFCRRHAWHTFPSGLFVLFTEQLPLPSQSNCCAHNANSLSCLLLRQ